MLSGISMDSYWILLGGFILLAYTLEAITGFGSIVIALSLGVLFLPFDEVLPVLVCLNIFMTSYLSFHNRRYIHQTLLLKVILPGMLLGTLFGYWVKPYINDIFLKQVFGIFITWFSARELWHISNASTGKTRSDWQTKVITLVAGISHGLFASGGPLLVYAVAGTKVNKAQFRATLVFVWFILNGLLSMAFLIDGRLYPVIPKIAMYLPLLLVAVLQGNYMHHKVDQLYFKKIIYYLLLLTGTLLIISPYIVGL